MNRSFARFERPEADALDGLLASYSLGALTPALHSLVASHLSINPTNRSFVAALDELAALQIDRIEAAPISDREARLQAIFSQSTDSKALDRAKVQEADPMLPAPLRRYLGRPFADLRWRTRMPGVRSHVVEHSGRGEASFLRVKGGRRMPSHTHEGMEVTLVLSGAFTDQSSRYGRGDIAIAESDLDHRPMVEEGEDCVCFVVTDAPLHLTGPVGRILDRFFGS